MATRQDNAPRTVNELCDRYQAWAEGYYRKPTRDGGTRPTREHRAVRDALRTLRMVAGDKAPDELAAEDLLAAQDWMIQQDNCRQVINRRCKTIRRMLKWAACPPQRFIPLTILDDFKLVPALKRGRTKAREAADVKPVPWEHVERTIKHADDRIATLILVHWHTGTRPWEVCDMRRSELRDAGDVMLYEPAEHKTDMYGVKRTIVIGPRGKEAILPWLAMMPPEIDALFGITTDGYRQAVARVNQRHGIPHWSPRQIRHSFASRLRETMGDDVGLATAQTLLGHTEVSTTQIYAEASLANAQRVMQDFG